MYFQNVVKLAQQRISFKDLLKLERPTFIAFDVLIGILLLVILIACPYASARSCCKACKKDFTRSDYKKWEKNKPGIWYLILAILMVVVDLFIIFESINVYFISK